MKIEELLKKYMEGSCTPAEEVAAKKWLETHIADPAYDGLFEGLLDDTPMSDDSESSERVIRNLERFIDAEISESKKAERRRRGFRWLNAGIIAAAIAAFFILQENEEPVRWQEAYAKVGETERITLADGTELWLNSGTKVIYPSRFDSDVRSIFIDGEIYAEVTPNKKKPFIVNAPEINVKVHGTSFGVKAFSEMPNAEVALISGSVTVEDNDNHGFSRTMKPGEMIRYNHQFGTAEKYTIDPETYGSWQNNHNIRFINQSLEEIAGDLERRFDVEIIIEDSSLARSQFYASFIHNENLETILKALNSDGSMNITRKDRIIIISAK